MFHIALGNVADSAGEFHSGGTAADDHEVQVRVHAFDQGFAFGHLESQQHAAADFEGVFEGFETGGELLPFGMSEVGVGGASGYDQVVVAQFDVVNLYFAVGEIEAGYLA